MDGDRPTTAAAAASVRSVLGDDDLFREILLRLGFPNCLVRASLVSKRWLLHASDPALLRLFRERHPPRLLGFCVSNDARYQFVQLEQSPELAALSRRVASSCNAAFGCRGPGIGHSRNGRLITTLFHGGRVKHSLLAPLLSGESEVQRKVRAEVYVLGSGGWGFPATAMTEVPNPAAFLTKMLPPVRGKVFMVTSFGCILGLDLAAARFLMLELPAGIGRNYMLSSAEGSGIYLVNADGFQLSVWLHRMMSNSDGASGWLLVDTFCVREAYSSAGHNWVWMPQDGDFLGVDAVGDNAEFVFLDYARYGVVLYVHLRSRVVKKVYEQAPYHHGFFRMGLSHIHVSPFMMVWPPVFPAKKRDTIKSNDPAVL
uniref:F-box domain-containing protein n=1 Tax=Triticum aestivum TaxID=4565 RepID=A0A077S462_WHEAT|nr:unnamed protein product [Triticum aestivum]CDM86181.1 unnamed protein product [Triticum aestivum]